MDEIPTPTVPGAPDYRTLLCIITAQYVTCCNALSADRDPRAAVPVLNRPNSPLLNPLLAFDASCIESYRTILDTRYSILTADR